MKNLFLAAVLALSYTEFNENTNEALPTTVSIQQEKDGCTITAKEQRVIRITRYDVQGSLSELSEQSLDGKTTFRCVHQGTEISVSLPNRQASFKCKGRPWIQDFLFGLKNFVLSDQKELKYVTINPKDLSLIDMIVTKKGVEIVQGKTAIKLYVTLQGWKSMFWDASVWIDQATGLLVKMKANRGPGTPTLITTLNP